MPLTQVTVASARPKLYPPGLVLHTSAVERGQASDGDSWVVGADLASFGELRLSATMGSSHLPQSYARALLGDLPVAAVEQPVSSTRTPPAPWCRRDPSLD